MKSHLNPYLNFRDSTRQAMEFYHSIFGGKLSISTFKDFGAAQSPSEENLIMHSQIDTDKGTLFMAADTPSSYPYSQGTDMYMSLSGDDAAELTGYFEKLAVGGTVEQPLMAAPWGDTFGMLRDKYGVKWMVNIAPKRG